MVVVGLLLAFAVFVLAMTMMAKGDDIVWQRRVYLFGAVEAIVFTAVGWLFGREVHRGEARVARAEAEASRQDAAEAREDASAQRDRAAVAETTAAAERVRGLAVRAAVDNLGAPEAAVDGGPRDASRRPAEAGRQPVDLQGFLRDLYPPGPSR